MASRVLLDTSALYALVSASDDFHERAVQLYEGVLNRGDELYVTSYVLVETTALVHRRLGFEPLRALINSIGEVAATYWVDAGTHRTAWELLTARQGERLSFVDCSTIAVARRLGSSIFAFDQDFVEEGVPVLS